MATVQQDTPTQNGSGTIPPSTSPLAGVINALGQPIVPTLPADITMSLPPIAADQAAAKPPKPPKKRHRDQENDGDQDD